MPSITRPQPIENKVSPANSSLSLRKEVVDLAQRVARRLDHFRGERADLDAVAFADLDIDGGNRAGFPARGDDAAMVALLECGDAAGVVAMMMGDQNIGQRPAGGGERGLDGRRLRRIDGGGGAGRGIVHEDAVIVLEAGKQPGLRSHRSVHDLIQRRVVAWPGDACSLAARWLSQRVACRCEMPIAPVAAGDDPGDNSMAVVRHL